MKLINRIVTISFVAMMFFFLGNTQYVHADSITPAIFEKSLTTNSTTTGSLTFKNDSDQTVTISPEVSAYDPKTLTLISSDSTIFITMDKETYNVKTGQTLTLSYQIQPPQNLSAGTYFNIIVLKKNDDATYLNQKNSLGVNQSLSQLVAINIFEAKDATNLQLGINFAQISMTIEDPGIPFLKPMKIKYTYQNTTNYVLTPTGDIQTFDNKSSYAPSYIKINQTGEKLYPGDTKEETITIDKWHISDILFGRKIVGRFYNGIDENSQVKTLSQNTYYIYLGIILIVIFLAIILIKSIQKDKKKSS